MVRISGELVIARPPDDVFDFVADERNEPSYNPRLLRVEQLTTGPIGLGTRFKAVAATMGREAEMEIAFTGFERPRRLESTTRMAAMEIVGVLTFDPVPEGTRMRWEWEMTPRGPYKLLTPLLGRLGRRQEEAIWTSLKRHLESSATPTVTG